MQTKAILRVPANNLTGYYRMSLPGIIDIAYPTSKLRRGRVQQGGSQPYDNDRLSVGMAMDRITTPIRYVLGRTNNRG